MSEAVAEKVVCVTGAAGFIASWLVKLLLLRGYTVKATLRNPGQYHSNFHVSGLLVTNLLFEYENEWFIAQMPGLHIGCRTRREHL